MNLSIEAHKVMPKSMRTFTDSICFPQAALIVDVLRSAGYLHRNGMPGVQLGDVILMGHSMGGGIAVATAAMLKSVAGVAAEAPAVRHKLLLFYACPIIYGL